MSQLKTGMVLAILASGLMELVQVNSPLRYEEMRPLVGGNVERVEINSLSKGLTIYLNEEGKLNGLKPNEKGNSLAKKHGRMLHGDFLVGDVFVCFDNDEDGDSYPLTDEHIKLLKEFFVVEEFPVRVAAV